MAGTYFSGFLLFVFVDFFFSCKYQYDFLWFVVILLASVVLVLRSL